MPYDLNENEAQKNTLDPNGNVITTEELVKQFWTDYLTLCNKYHMKIHSCGCCCSPWIVDLREERATLAEDASPTGKEITVEKIS